MTSKNIFDMLVDLELAHSPPENFSPAADGSKYKDPQPDTMQSKRPWNTQP